MPKPLNSRNRLPRSLKNQLRGARNPHAVLSEIRGTLKPALYKSLLEWLPGLTGQKTRAVNPAFPTSFGMLIPQSFVHAAMPLGKELQWATARVLTATSRIQEYLSLRSQIESALLSGSFPEVEKLLDELEATQGVSLFTLELRLTLLQLNKGLERQKAFASNVRQSSASNLLKVITFYLSEKNESATNPILFRERVEAVGAGLNASREVASYFVYRMTRHLPELRPEIAGILRVELNSSLIDQYETLILILTELSQNLAVATASLEDLRRSLNDPRLERLATLYGLSGDGRVLGTASEIAAELALDKGEPHAALDYVSQNVDTTSPILSVITGALSSNDLYIEPVSDTSTLLDRFRQLIFAVAVKDEGYEDQLFELIRLIDCFAALNFADPLRLVMLELAASTYHLTTAQLRRAYVSTAQVNPFCVPIIPSGLREAILPMIGVADVGPFDSVRWSLFNDGDAAILEIRNDTLPKRILRQLIRRRIHALIGGGRIYEAIQELVDAYLNDPQMVLMLPLSPLAQAVDDSNEEHICDPLALAIAYDLYLLFAGDERPFIRNDAFEEFLSSQGVERPSDLDLVSMPQPAKGRAVRFLSAVCTPELMSTTGIFSTTKEVEDERLRICSQLLELAPENASAYQKELRDITRHQIVSEGLRNVEQGKFMIDTQPLRRWIDKNLKESFARFQALRIAGVKLQNSTTLPKIDAELNLPISPIDEAAFLLNDMLDRFLFEAYTNANYGLDSYISLRARHGALAGQLRAPLEEEHVITQREEDSNVYKPNYRLLNTIDAASNIRESVSSKLRDFSAKFDAAIKRFADSALQINSQEKRDGLFSFSVEELDYILLESEVRSDSSLASFTDQCVELFWANVDDSLSRVRAFVGHQLRKELTSLIVGLSTSLESLNLIGGGLEEVINAVKRSHTQVNQAISNLESWFFAPRAAATRLYLMDEIVDIGLQQVKRLHPNFDPEPNKHVELDTPVLDLRRFADIFFIIFENIQRHSQMQRPIVDIAIFHRSNRLQIEVISDMKHRDSLEEHLVPIRRAIEGDRYHDKVKSEGGTGLVKLWNIIRSDEGIPVEGARLEFGERQGRFRLALSMPLTIVGTGGNASDETVVSGR